MVQFRELLKLLHDNDVTFVLIGGVAGALHGSPVATFDIDVCAPMDDANLQKIIDALRGVRPRLRMRPDKMPMPTELDRMRGINNIYLATDHGVIDLLGDLPGIGTFHDLADKTVTMDLGGFTVRVLDLDTLIRVKHLTGRVKDKLQIPHLEAARRMRQQNPGLFDPQ